MNAYVWGVLAIVALAVVGAYLVHRAMEVRGPRRELPSDPKDRLARALEDMRLRGIATPEELVAEVEVSEELSVAPLAPSDDPGDKAAKRRRP